METTVLYNIGCTGLTRGGWDKLDALQRRHLRRILRVRYPNQLSNAEIYRRTETEPWSVTACRRRWRQLGHELRTHEDAPARAALTSAARGGWQRPRGRPRLNLWTQLGYDYQMIRPRSDFRITRADRLMTLWEDQDDVDDFYAACRRKYRPLDEDDLRTLTQKAADRRTWRALVHRMTEEYSRKRERHMEEQSRARAERRRRDVAELAANPQEPEQVMTRPKKGRLPKPKQRRARPRPKGQCTLGSDGGVIQDERKAEETTDPKCRRTKRGGRRKQFAKRSAQKEARREFDKHEQELDTTKHLQHTTQPTILHWFPNRTTADSTTMTHEGSRSAAPADEDTAQEERAQQKERRRHRRRARRKQGQG